ncbi:MAG TPA: Ku protein [Candidatus Limnocylindrales bacterium]|nr:Ku protein [Candidatus Limnocylindrales bacterium]
MAQEDLEKTQTETEKVSGTVPRRPMWSGSITIGLVNVPVKLFTMVYDKGITFHFLHKVDGQPLKYVKMCTKDDKIVPWNEVIRGYEVSKNEYVTLDKKELDAVKPESDNRIRISKFVDYFSVDPVYFDTTYALMPDKNKEAYALLLRALEKKNKAGAGRITMRTKEYPALLHAYKGALVLTTLRYAYDVVNPQDFEEIHKLKEPEKAELDMAMKIITELSGDFDINEFQDTYKQRVEELIAQKLKGEKIHVEKPPQVEAKGLMTALRETIKQLEQK